MDIISFVGIVTVLTLQFASFCQANRDYSSGDVEYLMKYGYISKESKHSGSLRSQEVVSKGIAQFQRMAGLPVTGVVDSETIRMMKLPRCGNSDDMGYSDQARKKRYALHGSKWSKYDITYTISEYSKKISKTDVDSEIRRAFDAWEGVTPLTFTWKKSGTVDIDIKFARSWHGDNNPFDGKGQTLAHAFFPQYGGDAHFDEDEPWTINVSDGVNFFQVAVHEIGHSLGLAHSDVYSALMAPFYKGYQKDFRLGTDDVEAAQALYGTPNSRPNPTQQTFRPPPTRRPFTPVPTTRPKPRVTTRPPVFNIPEICRNPTIDAITRTKDGSTYVFKGIYHYRLTKLGIETGYPRKISTDWKGVTGPVDAALTWENGYTYVFKGKYYWKFENRRLIYGPKRIVFGFRGVPINLDAAMVWGGNGKTYFFKGDQYWRYSGRKIDYGYPRAIVKWRGLPSTIQGAFKWENGKTYFFTGKNYYRYNDQLFSVDATYPRPIATWWLGCPQQGKITDVKNPYSQDQSVHTEKNNKDQQWITIEDDDDSHDQKRDGKILDHNSATLVNLNPISILTAVLVTVLSVVL
ncbi:matrix metalloproteinase-16-like [Mizuhopecten yessoensis]|uniref:Matrix metalloproteinase-16 n=1 Tax=Mizuhopecten yessoensis TaxID=6573 RepID=A0A210Q4I9_MIZYE|nr:matrix metalloproteinase-16-like [Mizuhopecten yessoensis]OWF43599.1 Matrix metalloproteinase-16 [Mizuhopecten yessoensis]